MKKSFTFLFLFVFLGLGVYAQTKTSITVWNTETEKNETYTNMIEAGLMQRAWLLQGRFDEARVAYFDSFKVFDQDWTDYEQSGAVPTPYATKQVLVSFINNLEDDFRSHKNWAIIQQFDTGISIMVAIRQDGSKSFTWWSNDTSEAYTLYKVYMRLD